MSLKTNIRPLAPHLLLRSYRPEDHDGCERLEITANQFQMKAFEKLPLVGPSLQRWVDSLNQIEQRHLRGFDARAKTAPDYEILVCEDTKKSSIAAVVAIDIRTNMVQGVPCKVGWLYDLRVDQDYQRQGIAMALSAEAEERCRQKDVDMLYLTVWKKNEKAKKLYQALGYQDASSRSPCSKMLMGHERLPSDMVAVRLQPGLAACLTAEYYGTKDMSLASVDDYQSLLESGDCLGTCLVLPKKELPDYCTQLLEKGVDEEELGPAIQVAIRNGDIHNYAGVSLWNSSGLKYFQVERLLGLTKETWLSLWLQLLLLVMLALPLCLWWWSILGRMLTSDSGLSWAIAESLVLLIVALVVCKVARFFRFVVTRDSHHLFTRAFGTFHQGPRGLECLKNAALASRNVAKSYHSAGWVINIDDGHPDADSFPKSNHPNLSAFLQKWLKEPPCNSERWPLFTPGGFADPRDL